MVRSLQEAIKGLLTVKDKDLVIALGNTDTGKSTMLSSLIYGPDKLEV